MSRKRDQHPSKSERRRRRDRRRTMPSLSQHPIFSVPSETYYSLKRTTRRNVVAFKGTEVYVAVGSTVRCAELREWYAMDSESEDDKSYYQVRTHWISFLMVDSSISKLDVSDTGTGVELLRDTISVCRNTQPRSHHVPTTRSFKSHQSRLYPSKVPLSLNFPN